MIAPSRFGDGLQSVEPLEWDRPVLAARDLERLTFRGRKIILPARVVVTPLARDWLAASGVVVERKGPVSTAAAWGYIQERPFPLVGAAAKGLAKEGLTLVEIPGEASPRWAVNVAGRILSGELRGGLFFCGDPSLICCVANKLPGVRAAAVCDVFQAARATLTLAANLLAVEMPGRTFYEIKQILTEFCRRDHVTCPEPAATVIREIERG
jgi:ribose 5-phosphate isomerase RpiB